MEQPTLPKWRDLQVKRLAGVPIGGIAADLCDEMGQMLEYAESLKMDRPLSLRVRDFVDREWLKSKNGYWSGTQADKAKETGELWTRTVRNMAIADFARYVQDEKRQDLVTMLLEQFDSGTTGVSQVPAECVLARLESEHEDFTPEDWDALIQEGWDWS